MPVANFSGAVATTVGESCLMKVGSQMIEASCLRVVSILYIVQLTEFQHNFRELSFH